MTAAVGGGVCDNFLHPLCATEQVTAPYNTPVPRGRPNWGRGSMAAGQGRAARLGAAVQLPACHWRARTAAGTEVQNRTWGVARRLGGPRSGGAAHSAAAQSASGVDLAALWAAQSTAGAEHGAPLPSLGPEPSQEAPAPRPHPEGVSRTPLLLG